MGLIKWHHHKTAPTTISCVQQPTTSLSKAASVDSLSAQIETGSCSTPQRPSDGNKPPFLPLTSPACNAADALRRVLARPNQDITSLSEGDLPKIDEEVNNVEAPIETSSEENTVPVSTTIEPASISFVVDTAAEEAQIEDLPGLSTPLEFAQFGYISRESFNTSVLPLLQPSPDAPIGGLEVFPMEKDHHSLGTKVLRGSSQHFEIPQIEVSSPRDSMLGYKKGKRTALRSTSNFSDPCYDLLSVWPISRPQSPKTPTMFTVPQTPRQEVTRQSERSSFEFDGPASGEPGCYGLEGGDVLEEGTNPCADSECRVSETDGYSASGVPHVDYAERPDFPLDGRVPPIPTAPPALGVPMDNTGMASTPPTPSRTSRIKRKPKKLASKGIRKARKAMLRKPVLNLVVGRQLAKPTAALLKLAASGSPFEVPDIGTFVTVPGPGPMLV